MNCRACDYPLWNLRARACPECGTAFAPSDFDFHPGAVRFLCPHCNQQYFGTDARGHLVPTAFNCVACGGQVEMDQMLLLPAEGIAEGRTAPHQMPWTRPDSRSFWRRWWDTTAMALVRPGDLMAARDDSSSLKAAWGYFLATQGLIALVGVMFSVVFMGGIFAIAAAAGGGAGGGGAGGVPAGAWLPLVAVQAGTMLAALAVVVIFTWVWSLAAHAAVAVTGTRSGTLRSTMHAVLYSSGANALALIPCINNIAWIWWLVSAVLMLRRAQGISGWRASLAGLWLPVGAILTIIGLYIAFFVMVISAAGATGGPGAFTPTGPDPSLGFVANAIEARAASAGGWGPRDHAIALVLEGHLEPDEFVGEHTPTPYDSVSIAGVPLRDLIDADAQGRAELAAAIAPLPAGVVAHRAGDFVFTWHGIDAATPPPGLWIAVLSPDPDANAWAPTTTPFWVILTEPGGTLGTSQVWTPVQAALAAQNQARAAHGLAPLPDPATVTADRPAVSAGAAAPPSAPGP